MTTDPRSLIHRHLSANGPASAAELAAYVLEQAPGIDDPAQAARAVAAALLDPRTAHLCATQGPGIYDAGPASKCQPPHPTTPAIPLCWCKLRLYPIRSLEIAAIHVRPAQIGRLWACFDGHLSTFNADPREASK